MNRECCKCGGAAVAWVNYVDGWMCQECWDLIPESANATGDYIDDMSPEEE